jgi:glycine dehydrogenase subunit 1
MANARALLEGLKAVPGLRAPLFKGPYFNEITVGVPVDASWLQEVCLGDGVVPGVPLSKAFPELGETLALAATELTTAHAIARLKSSLEARLQQAPKAQVAAAPKGGALR